MVVLPLVVAGALLIGLAGPASAAPIAYNTKTQFLTARPTDNLATSCVQRRIALAGATYEWGAYTGGAYFPERGIGIRAGNYTWKDCLDPKNGYYQHSSWLDPDAAGLPTASWTDTVTLSASGTIQWGSYLDPPF